MKSEKFKALLEENVYLLFQEKIKNLENFNLFLFEFVRENLNFLLVVRKKNKTLSERIT
jgi:hypothetical protein